MKVIIEKCNTNEGGGYAVYNTDSDSIVISGSGQTIAEAKDDFFSGMHDLEAAYELSGEPVPSELKEPVEFHFSVASVFDAFPWLNVSKFSKAIGINTSLMHQYKSGKAYISDAQLGRIEMGLHTIAAELAAVKLT